MDFEILTYRS